MPNNDRVSYCLSFSFLCKGLLRNDEDLVKVSGFLFLVSCSLGAVSLHRRVEPQRSQSTAKGRKGRVLRLCASLRILCALCV